MLELLRQVVVTACLAVMLWTNLAGGGRVDGDREPEMYSAFPTAFSPAPFTFAIWGPIFLGCVALTVYQALPTMRHDARFQTLGWYVAGAYLLTALTAFTPIGTSNVVITGLLVMLSLAYRESLRAEPHTVAFTWCVRLPLAIFLAWCTVATILNACQFAVSQGRPVGPASAAVLIGIASVIGIAVVIASKEVAFGIVLVWAFWGIVAARPEASSIVLAAMVGSLVLLAAMTYAWWGGPGSSPMWGGRTEPDAVADRGA